MHTYRIRYRKGNVGLRFIRADSVNGFQPNQDSYVFKMEGEVVAVMPKEVVVSVERVDNGEDES